MVIDIDVKSFYLSYIKNAEKDAIEFRRNREEAKKIKEELYNYIDERKEVLKNAYNIDVTKHDSEWNKKTYTDTETLYNKLIKMAKLTLDTTNSDRVVLLQAIKYCNVLRNEYKFTQLTTLSYKRKNLKFTEYRDIVRKYFLKVHKCILEGMGYDFGCGIGVLTINRWKIVDTKKKLDHHATNKRKKELLAQGVKLYDKLEAEWYKERNIPYDGVDYRVFINSDYLYEFRFYNTKIFTGTKLNYKHAEYVNSKLKGMTHKEIADTYCKSLEDIYNLPVDIRVKLNILLYLYPNKYLIFIRNVEQDRRKYRTYYCQTRQ